jgi:hypothetical protein
MRHENVVVRRSVIIARAIGSVLEPSHAQLSAERQNALSRWVRWQSDTWAFSAHATRLF